MDSLATFRRDRLLLLRAWNFSTKRKTEFQLETPIGL
jgi:hypothetical protein